MKRYIAVAAALTAFTLAPAAVFAQADTFRAGHNFMATEVFSEAEDKAILAAFEGLRMADVSDGMDYVGLVNTGLMDP